MNITKTSARGVGWGGDGGRTPGGRRWVDHPRASGDGTEDGDGTEGMGVRFERNGGDGTGWPNAKAATSAKEGAKKGGKLSASIVVQYCFINVFMVFYYCVPVLDYGLLVGSLFGVAAVTVAEGEEIEIATRGVFDLPKAPATIIVQGARVAWDDTAKQVALPGVGLFSVGVAVTVAGNGTTTVRVRLDGIATAAT